MDRPFVHLLWSLAKKTSLSCRRVPSSCCEPGVAQKENYLSFTFEFKMTAALGAEGRTVQGWVFDFFAFLFFSLTQPPFNQLSLAVFLACIHSLQNPCARFDFFPVARSRSALPPAAGHLGQYSERSLALKLNSCQLLGGSDFSGDLFFRVYRLKALPNKTAAFCNGSVEQRTKLGAMQAILAP